MNDLKHMSLDRSAKNERSYRLKLRYLCYHMLGIRCLTDKQRNLNIIIGFRDEVFRAATSELLKQNSPITKCKIWSYNLLKTNKILLNTRNGIDKTVTYQSIVDDLQRKQEARRNAVKLS